MSGETTDTDLDFETETESEPEIEDERKQNGWNLIQQPARSELEYRSILEPGQYILSKGRTKYVRIQEIMRNKPKVVGFLGKDKKIQLAVIPFENITRMIPAKVWKLQALRRRVKKAKQLEEERKIDITTVNPSFFDQFTIYILLPGKSTASKLPHKRIWTAREIKHQLGNEPYFAIDLPKYHSTLYVLMSMNGQSSSRKPFNQYEHFNKVATRYLHHEVPGSDTRLFGRALIVPYRAEMARIEPL